MALTEVAQQRLRQHFSALNQPLCLAVDATCGKGYDTEFLCSLGFAQVVGFDVQPRALHITQQRLQDAGWQNARLMLKNHSAIAQEIDQEIDCAMFNLGYLPGTDKTITTETESSIQALEQTLCRMAAHGIISILCYPGHPEGARETAAVRAWLEGIQDHWQVLTIESESVSNRTPVLFLISQER